MFGFASRKFWLAWLGISTLVLVLVSPPPLAAQAPPPVLTVEPFYGGYYKYGEWLPLRVSVANDGAPISAQLRVETTQTGSATVWLVPAELPTGARKQFTLYVMPPSFAQVARVRLMNGAQEVARAAAPLTLLNNSVYLVGVIASRGEAFNALSGVTLDAGMSRPVRVVAASLADIPDRVEGLFNFDALVISDVDTSTLSAEQGRALAAWVRAGGRLVLGGGASAARTLSGLPDALAGAFRTPNGVTEIDALDAFAKFTDQPVRVPGPFVASFADKGTALLEQDGHRLLAEQRVGEGFVTYSALDLAASPFDAWAGAARFWKQVLTPNSAYPSNFPTDVSPRLMRTRFVSQVLRNLPVLALPSLNLLSILLGVYIVLIGPVNYVALRRLKKLDWGWVTMPALTLLFAVGAFGVSNQMRGSDVVVNQISLVQLAARDAASQTETLVGVFSPTRGDFTLEFPATSLVMPISNQNDPFSARENFANNSVEIVLGEPTRVRGVEINQGALQAFVVKSTAPDDWRIEADLTTDGLAVRGTVVNRLNKPLTDAMLLNGDRSVSLGTLAPNETRTLNQDWTTLGDPFSGLARGSGNQADARRQILSSYFGLWSGPPQLPRRPLIIGWVDGAPVQVGIANAQPTTQNTTVILAEVELQRAGSAVSLHANDWQVGIVESTGGRNICGANNYVGVGDGHVVLEFSPTITLPARRVTKLTLVVQEANPQKIELQDQSGAWVVLDAPTTGRYDLENPARFVSPHGAVRMRISGKQEFDRCVLYNLELQGEVEQ